MENFEKRLERKCPSKNKIIFTWTTVVSKVDVNRNRRICTFDLNHIILLMKSGLIRTIR
jgi:hypothetical protein